MEKAVKITEEEFCDAAAWAIDQHVRANPMCMMIHDELCSVSALIACKLFSEESDDKE